ncbi:Guanylate-binding protein 1 [Varanus komodoensis]|nr:Guanylate-binding protein 1 [Varanus komodoensis]
MERPHSRREHRPEPPRGACPLPPSSLSDHLHWSPPSQAAEEVPQDIEPPSLAFLSLAQASDMDAPMCLIENKPGEKLQVNREALQLLQSIQQPVVVVAIVGLYRTGKSYLMNQLAGKNKGFALGATVQSKTKGIWMWCRPHPLRPGHTLVLLDTEGLGDVEKSNTENDSWIFALSILLCSTFVYNSMGTINHQALEQLQYLSARTGAKPPGPVGPQSTMIGAEEATVSQDALLALPTHPTPSYVTEITEHIKLRSSARTDGETADRLFGDLAMFFPSFIWVVRDFTLQLKEENGESFTEDEYLERALQRGKGDFINTFVGKNRRAGMPGDKQGIGKYLTSQWTTKYTEFWLMAILRWMGPWVWLGQAVACGLARAIQLNGLPVLDSLPDATEKRDLPKKFLRQYFPCRKCFVFDRPAERKDLERLEDLPESKLNPEFLQQARHFCDYVLQNAPAKGIQGGPPVTGKMLGGLAETYVDAIRRGAVPCIENAVLALAQAENAAAVREGLERYDEMVQLLSVLPAEDMTELLAVHARCEEEAIQVFLNHAFRDENQQHQHKLRNQLQLKLEELCLRDEQVSLDRCLAVLCELFQEVEERISRGAYAVAGGYQRFQADQQEVIEAYFRVANKGNMASKALHDFLKSKEGAADSILQADKNLTSKQKEMEAERARAEAAEREAQAQKKRHEQNEQLIQDMKRSHEEHKRQLMAKMEEDRKKLTDEFQISLNQKLLEQTRLQQEGHREEVSRLHREIQSLRNKIHEKRSSSCVIA